MISRNRTPEEERTAKFWDRQHWREVPLDYWASNPLVQSYINRRTTGDPDLRWLDWFRQRHASAVFDRGLCLACGAGTAELHAVGIGLCREMDACDISEGSLESARARAASLKLETRINYFRCDLNRASLAPGQYDLVLSSGGLHHIEQLEHLLDQVHACLKDGGLLAIDEYVGPARLQYTDLQLDVVQRIVDSLPAGLRTGKPVERPDLAYMLRNDPSEAVRAPELVSLLQKHFEVIELRPYGGTLLNVLFGCGAVDTRLLLPGEGAAAASPSHADVLPMILLLEEMLTENEVLPSDYAVIVARR
jgi:SAM-dependent methyltransferase